MKLRTRLILAAVYLLVIVVVALEIPLAANVSERARSQLDSRLVQNATSVAARINDDVPDAGTDPAVPPDPPAVIAQTAQDWAESADPPVRIVIVDQLGRVLADTAGLAAVGTPYMTAERPEFDSAINGVEGGRIDVRTRESETAGEKLLLVTAPIVHRAPGTPVADAVGAVRISEPLSVVESQVRDTIVRFAAIGLAVILIGLALAWILAAGLARPVHRLADAAVQLGRGDLQARAPVEGPEEVATLARSFNRMADRLSANISAQRDFLANASHQLRTPLTGLRLRLEAIEQEGGFAASQASKAQAEVNRLNELVEDLLELAKASSLEATGGAVDLAHVAREAVDRWTGPAQQSGKQLVERVVGPCMVWASEDDLGHVIDNLIENSIRYTPEGTQIRVETKEEQDGSHSLVVADTGPGIPAGEQDRIFERFYRGSTGKLAGPGTGLGLAVVVELVGRWGGRVEIENGVGTTGTTIRASFPAAATIP